MITIYEFMWLIHYILIFGWFYEIASFAYNRIQYANLYNKAPDIAPHIFENEWAKYGSIIVAVGGAHSMIYGFFVAGAVPLTLMILIAVSAYCSIQKEALKPYIKAHKRDNPKGTVPQKPVNWKKWIGYTATIFVISQIIPMVMMPETYPDQWNIGVWRFPMILAVFAVFGAFGGAFMAFTFSRIRAANAEQTQTASGQKSYDDFARNDQTNDDSDFGFNEKAWKGNGSARASTEKSKPYGTEKHHPDDAALWNIVNDPNASEGEQLNALRAIKKREVKRRGK